MKKELETFCELHWWNGGRKTLSFKGELQDLLKKQGVKFTKRKSDIEGLYNFVFRNDYGVVYKVRGQVSDFAYYAKKFLQMELVRMGDKSQLYVAGTFRPTVTVNF